MKSYISPDIRTVEIGDIMDSNNGFDIVSGTEKDPGDEQLAPSSPFDQEGAPIKKSIWEED